MHLTLPRDIIDAVVNANISDDEPSIGILLGQIRPAESLAQVWGYTDLQPLADEERIVGNLADTVTNDKFEIETADELYRTKFSPPDSPLDPIGILISSEQGQLPRSLCQVDIPVIQLLEDSRRVPIESNPSSVVKVHKSDPQVILYDSENCSEPDAGIEIIHAHRDAQKRIDGLIDIDTLEDSHVTIVGLGTVGSTVAVELAKAGVGSFTLLDFDRLEIHNVTRHICGVDDLGRMKTHAVRDYIRRTNPRATINVESIDITDAPDKVHRIASNSDIVAVCTDSDPSKLIMNRECLRADVPAVYAGVYERAMGGDIIRIRPGETPCYDCILGNMSEEMNRDERVAGDPDYTRSGDDQPGPEPGLSTDAGFISLIQAKYILSTLLSDTQDYQSDFVRDMCFWGNEDEYIFTRPLQSRFATVEYRKGCRTCNGTGTIESNSIPEDGPSIPTEVDEDPRPN
ncbi:hypothetical protein GOC74_00010 [Halomicrobium mukohataei]|uniref:THIF-type NAD/FAD binding fold domain-containing protein n=1 Tax=Halomicrobium mukohataei TaxID=57705 RepID=A0A847U6V4_9EURY|nr:ThiF family adenylyltransferase [Halomicrobium mukohataei]NLV08336.1 hypothetical protein [Halomicrobium mukohataei]